MVWLPRTMMLALLAIGGVPAQAAWHRAISKHFIVYANEAPDQLKRRIDDLEAADAVLRLLHRTGEGEGVEDNRLTVYVTRNESTLRRIYGDSDAGVAGFYLPRASGSVAFTPAVGEGDGARTDLKPQTVLIHEYGHHFLSGNYALAYPAWFSEGYAEFVGTMKIDDRQIVVGPAAMHRAYGLFSSDGLSLKAMFAPPAKLTMAEVQTIYARGWLLTHFLLLDPRRAKQLDKYLADFNAGKPPVAAAEAAFGDLRKLDGELRSYVMRPRLPARGVDRTKLSIPAPQIRSLSGGEAAMIEARMLSVRGTNAQGAQKIFQAGAKVAAQYPGDAVVQGWFAEMALDAGRDDLAEAAADRAIAIDPTQTQALLYKARVRMNHARKPGGTAADWRDARSFIVRANKQSNDNAEALAMFYDSYAAEGKPPTRNAVEALLRAHQLVPQDPSLRLQVVSYYIGDGKIAEARATLLPLAYNPHSRQDSPPRRLLDAIDAKADRATLLALVATTADDAKKD